MELAASKSLFLVPFPKISVKAENNEIIYVSSELVCASRKLRRRITRHMQEYNKWPKGYNTQLTMTYSSHYEEISAIKFIDCTEDITDGSWDVFGRLPILSSYVWRLLNDWSVFHILQVKEQLEIQQRNKECNWNQPAVFVPNSGKDWNAVSDFEEKMFGNMDPHKFLSVVQGKNDLGLDDLHKVLENWFRLYNGREKPEKDKDGNEMPVEPNMVYKKNFRADSNHFVRNIKFYGPAIRPVPFNAKGWTWWSRSRDKPGNDSFPTERS